MTTILTNFKSRVSYSRKLDRNKDTMSSEVEGRGKRHGFQRILLYIICSGAVGAAIGCFAMWFGFRYSSDFLSETPKSQTKKPNFVIILADDVGYGDFQVFGHPNQEWTGVDRMAKEGKKFTHFYSPVAVCSPSRAAILTGRYPVRSGIFGNRGRAFSQTSPGGLPRSEVTIAEALKKGGYVTGVGGKWHLGINKDNNSDGYHLPMHHGFDVVNTILPLSQHWLCNQRKSYFPAMSKSCFLYKSNDIIEQPINLGSLTSRMLNETVGFINTYKDDSFFYLLSFPQAHSSLFASRRFSGSSKRGLYGDSINEMGWAINEVLDHLVKLGLDSQTFVLFLSDHGPLQNGCGEEGSSGIFRGGKRSTWEGGVRVPVVAWWPGTIDANTINHDVASTLDIFPTLMRLSNLSEHTENLVIDGIPLEHKIIGDELTSSESSNTVARPLFFYCGNTLTAARYKNYKIHYHTSIAQDDPLVKDGMPRCDVRDVNHFRRYNISISCEKTYVKRDPPLLFDVELDMREHIFLDPTSHKYKKTVEEIGKLVKIHETSIDAVESEIDRPRIPDLQPCCNPPACMCNFEE